MGWVVGTGGGRGKGLTKGLSWPRTRGGVLYGLRERRERGRGQVKPATMKDLYVCNSKLEIWFLTVHLMFNDNENEIETKS